MAKAYIVVLTDFPQVACAFPRVNREYLERKDLA